ncbi:siroheme synthase CysG [Siccirubricoccus sp. KC 17139]|uniref:Siroheme synthase CysG n=1 Tax=Siccirubricoccus soli TaxID=2899147 RepID=A0ABT1D5C1_9PROT|nr:siroheme synthase CysG [Siccirubricoccus soli]MCO6416414.1 siroheme synthase CysG [Siccirubricoccus soli]MCP2682548.1 siroheme synthase CysG [Siccirubricoccus soli]
MQHFPVFLDLAGRLALVLGEGEVAARKAALLRQAGAELRLAPRFSPELLDGVALAIGANAPEAELQALAEAARARGVPVNIVDRPALCTAILPAIIDRAPVTIAISSGGAAPVLARLLRQRVEAVLPPGIGRVAALAGRFREAVRRRLPELGARRRFLEAVLAGPPAALAEAGRKEEADRAFAAALEQAETVPQGMVHIVGAGPGAGDLLTLRALRLLGEADVILHDRLGTAAALEMARRDAERLCVGPTAETGALMVRLAREGKRVVRLKGGDPLVFGHGTEEMAALTEAGIPWAIVPGITAALACAAGARIPLTDRETTHALTLVTGHRRVVGPALHGLAQPGQTLAIYMPMTALAEISAGLVAEGLDPATPAALVERGGTPEQRALHGTLRSLAAEAPLWVTEGPCLLLVGPSIGRAPRPAEE